MYRFGQVVIGAPGAGKTTYAHGIQQWMKCVGREATIVNLDPMASHLPYDCSLDIRDLISGEQVMDEFELGPNGSLIYCIEFLEHNFDWLMQKLEELGDAGNYVVFDCPGQLELYTHHSSMKKIFSKLSRDLGFQLCAVQLIDSHHCSDASKFISVLLLCLSSTTHLELPMVNVLSKIDMLDTFGDLDFPLDYYTDAMDLEYILNKLPQDPFYSKFRLMAQGIIEVIESYNLVSFTTLQVQDAQSIGTVVKHVDKANGYVFSSLDEGVLLNSAFRFAVPGPPEAFAQEDVAEHQ